MELLIQALDEFDDLMTSMRQIWLRYRSTPRRNSRARAVLRVAPSGQA